MRTPIKLSFSIFLMLMVIQATLTSPVNIKHEMKDCGLSSCDLTIEEPKETPDDINTLFDKLRKELGKQELNKDKHLSYDPKSHYKNEGEDKNHKKDSAEQLTKHAFAHAESIIENSSSYEKSGEAKKKLMEIETKISHHELNNGKPITQNLYSYKKLSGSDQQLKESETKFSKQVQYPALPVAENKNNAKTDENLLKLLPKFDNENTVSHKKHFNSVMQSYENSDESNRKLLESASKVFQREFSKDNQLSKNLHSYEQITESNKKYKGLESKISNHGLTLANSETDNKKSRYYDEIKQVLQELLSKQAAKNSVHNNKLLIGSESKLPKQEANQVKSLIEDSHSYENSGEYIKKLIELASKTSHHDLFNSNQISKGFNSYEKINESNKKYKEGETKLPTHGLTITNSETDVEKSSNYDNIEKVLRELLLKIAKQNSVHGNKHWIESESKLPKQEATQVKSFTEDSYSYGNSGESNRKLVESETKFSNEKPKIYDYLPYKSSAENNPKLLELLIELLKQKETQVKSIIEDSHSHDNSGESNRKLIELALKVLQNNLSNGSQIRKDLDSYEKINESKTKYKESESTVSKHDLAIVKSEIGNKKSSNHEEIEKVLRELLSKNAKLNFVHDNKHLVESESKLPKQKETQVKSIIEDSHSYENSGESNRKLIELALKVLQNDLSKSNKKIAESETTFSNDKSKIYDYLPDKSSGENNAKLLELLIELAKQKLTLKNPIEPKKKQCELQKKSSQHNVQDVWALIGGLLSNNNPVGTNKQLLQLAAKLSNNEFVSAVALIDDLIYQNNPDATKIELIKLKAKLLQAIPTDQNSENNGMISQINSVESTNSLKEQMEETTNNYAEANSNLIVTKLPKYEYTIVQPSVDVSSTNYHTNSNSHLNEVLAELLREKLKDIQIKRNAVLTNKNPLDSNNEVVIKLLDGLNSRLVSNDELTSDNPIKNYSSFKNEVSSGHPYGNDELSYVNPIENYNNYKNEVSSGHPYGNDELSYDSYVRSYAYPIKENKD